MIVCKEENEMG